MTRLGEIGTPVATLPGAWRYRVSAGTGRSGVSILWVGEVESLICSFYLSVAAHKNEQICPWDTLACWWDVKLPTTTTTTTTTTNNNNKKKKQNKKLVYVCPFLTAYCSVLFYSLLHRLEITVPVGWALNTNNLFAVLFCCMQFPYYAEL